LIKAKYDERVEVIKRIDLCEELSKYGLIVISIWFSMEAK